MNTFAQKFVTPSVSGGARIKVYMENYDTSTSTYSDGVTPNYIKIALYTWNSTYGTTIAGTPLVTSYATIASEHIEDAEQWVYLFWEALAAGTYMWLITVIYGDDTGSLHVSYDPDSTKADSWKSAVILSGDYYSEIMGLDAETYEYVVSDGDTYDGGFVVDGGSSKVYVKNGGVYKAAAPMNDVVETAGGLKGRVMTGSMVNLS